MPLQDTGLDFYESSMRPVRAGIQSIITRADQNRKELEAEKIRIAAEERAEARGLARERRVEDAAIRTEERRAKTTRSLERARLLAVARIRGLALTEPDGSQSSNEVLTVRIDKDEKQRGPLETARINLKFMEQILPAETIDRIRSGDISAKELTAINAETKVAVADLAAGESKERLRESPQHLWEVKQAKAGLKRINEELTEIQGDAIWKHAQGVVDKFNAGETTDAEVTKIAGTFAISDPNASRIVSKPELKPAAARFIIDRHPDGSPKRDSNGDNVWIAVADLTAEERAAAHARGEIEVQGLAWAMQNKPAHVLVGDWPVGVSPEGKPFNVYDPIVGGDLSHQHLLVAYGKGMVEAAKIAKQRGEFDWWSSDLQLDVERLKFSAKQPEIQALLGRQTKIYEQFPELWDYDPNTDTTRPPSEIEKGPPKTSQAPAPAPASAPDPQPDVSNAVALLDADDATATTPAAVIPAVPGADLNDDGTPWNEHDVAPPFDVAPPAGFSGEQIRAAAAATGVDSSIVYPWEDENSATERQEEYEQMLADGQNPDSFDYFWRETMARKEAARQPYEQEVAAPTPPRSAEEIELEGYPVQAPGYYHRAGTPEGFSALMPSSPPLDAQAVGEIMGGRPATSREATEGLSRMRDALYGGFAQPGDYDPRLPGAMSEAENAIRGQLGQAPPLLGRTPTVPQASPPIAPQATAQGYGELREAPLTPSDRARKARLFHLYRNPLQGRKKGGQRLMELAARGR